MDTQRYQQIVNSIAADIAAGFMTTTQAKMINDSDEGFTIETEVENVTVRHEGASVKWEDVLSELATYTHGQHLVDTM